MPESPQIRNHSKNSTTVRSFPILLRSLAALLRAVFRLLGRWAPGLAARLAERLFTTPPRHRRPPRERRWLEGAERSQVAGPRGPLAVWTWEPGGARAAGDGGAAEDRPRGTVLLVHGWGGRGSQLGAFVEPLLREGLRVVTFDAYGHGDTGGRRSGRRSSLPEVIESLEAVAAEVGPLEGLVAHSLGGGAAAYALGRGLSMKRLVFLAPGLDPAAYLEQLHRMVGVPWPVLERMRQRLEERFGIPWSEFRAVDHPRAEPLLIFHDPADPETPISISRELAASWPRARLLPVDGLGHRRIVRDPEVVERAVGFLDGERQRAVA